MTQPPHQPGHQPDDSSAPEATPGDPQVSAPPAPQTTPGLPAGTGLPAAPEASAPATKSRKGLVIGIVAGVLALLGVGGVAAAVLVARNADAGRGEATATEAVTEFMRAAYRDRDRDRAFELVCGRAQDPARLDAKINEIDELAKSTNGSFTWSEPTVAEESEETTTVTTTVKLATTDERLSTVDLRFVVVENEGWLVCDVS